MKSKILGAIVVLLFLSCSKDYLETSPTNQISDQVIFQTIDGAQSVIDGILRDMRSKHGPANQHDQFGVKAVDLAVDLMGEDIAVEQFHWFGANYRFENRRATDVHSVYVWSLFYRIIYNANAVINHIDETSSDSENKKKNLKAQALTLRAYSYFQLIQLYQHTYLGCQNDHGVPIYTRAITEGAPRSSVSEVYQQIYNDLYDAIQLYKESKLQQRHISDPTLNVAKGLLARAALVREDWETAAEMASAARQNYFIMSSEQFRMGFDNYLEQNWMWGFEINNEQSTTYASWFSHMDWTIGGYCGFGFSRKSFSIQLYHLMDDNDVRKKLVDASSLETGRLIPYKFAAGGDKDFAADLVMMRPEEMLLIEAEACVRLNEEDRARNLLMQLRNRRFDNPVVVTDKGDMLLSEILLERRIELWGEGFRGFDIKRLKIDLDRNKSNHNPIVAKIMSLPSGSEKFIYQIPQVEIDANPNINITDQNP